MSRARGGANRRGGGGGGGNRQQEPQQQAPASPSREAPQQAQQAQQAQPGSGAHRVPRDAIQKGVAATAQPNLRQHMQQELENMLAGKGSGFAALAGLLALARPPPPQPRTALPLLAQARRWSRSPRSSSSRRA